MRRYILFVLLAFLLAPAMRGERFPDRVWKARFPHYVRPEYPYECRRRRISGSGIFRMHVDEKGHVTAITVVKSTGHRELDGAAMQGFVQWHGLPGPRWELDMPITFTMGRSR